jgi:hypothetical protein
LDSLQYIDITLLPWVESGTQELAVIADTPITMAVLVELVAAFAVMFPLLATPAVAGCIADIEHVVLFMQGASWFFVI